MLTCSNCGATVREGAKFCTSCGTRLNDAAASNATNAWATSSSDSSGEAATDDKSSDPATPAAVGEAPSPPADEGATAPETSASPDDGFTWSWGDAATAEDKPGETASDRLDEESGVVLENGERTTTDTETEAEPIVDATEVEILEDDHTRSDEEDAVEVVSSDTDAQRPAGTGAEEPGSDSESETLAAWAEQWESTPADAQPLETSAVTGTATDDDSEPEQRRDEGTAARDDEGEDTVARAERLIGELRAMIPSLVRPQPSLPSTSSMGDSSAVADDLEGAAKIGHFDDVREALLAARDNPRDVDNMLSLAGLVDRLLELLDDRNNLAKTAESAASRLRSSDTSTLM